MLNQLVLVGRLVNAPELSGTEDNKDVSRITLAVPRPYKNINGEYDTDFIDCKLFKNVSQDMVNQLQKGTVVGIKGRIQAFADEKSQSFVPEIIAERITFLSSSIEKINEKDDKNLKM